jgi:type II secretory ATPase GspE/PulE/Tfp pilus assembly ATPase PilB-like protein
VPTMIDQGSSNVVRLIDHVIRDAVKQGASDIHFEPTEQGLRIRFRIDGILRDHSMVELAVMSQCISRIKVMGHIDIAEKRIPHDGKFFFVIDGCSVDFRVSTFPTLHGEKVVVRILDRARTMISLAALGFSDDMLTRFKRLLGQSSGFFLVTGPTGSGKTTTLYAALSHLHSPEKNIITLEDPVEYHVIGITQGHIHPAAGFSFAKGLRALLRQDPDIVMVGEVRDRETAHIALEAALTGHLVLSTIHTTDAPGVIIRLMDMGIESFLINAALTGVLGQRLARLLCSACKYERKPNDQEKYLLEKYHSPLSGVYDAHGCEVCHNLGHKGRIGIFELLVVTEALRALVIQHPSTDQLVTQACADGTQPLFIDGLEKVARGLISLQELTKVAA